MKLVIYGSFNCPYSFLASQRVDHLVTLAIVAINGWNRFAVGLRSPVGSYVRRNEGRP
jgi:hypothetical protein